MQGTSLEAYDEIKDSLPKREAQVLRVIATHQPCSNQDIADHLFWAINRVTGRTNSLVKKGIVVEHDKAKNRFNRSVIRWKIA